MDHIYDSGSIDYNVADKFPLPSEVTAIMTA